MENKILQGDCLELMRELPDKSIDMILCDLPYGTTACKWDTVIPFEPLWEQYKRIIKDRGAVVLFGAEPFSSALRMSNIKQYKYDWVWDKKTISNPLQAKQQPLRQHENILIFGKGALDYFPIKTDAELKRKWKQGGVQQTTFGKVKPGASGIVEGKYPKTIIQCAPAKFEGNTMHPTQKPIALCEYLIKTYTNECETVLDNCAGSGTTAIACLNTNRKFILMEKELEYIEIINNRISEHEKNPRR